MRLAKQKSIDFFRVKNAINDRSYDRDNIESCLGKNIPTVRYDFQFYRS